MWHPFTQHQTAGNPLAIVKAKGAILTDNRGKEYIDANSSWWVNVHGHGHPHIAKALSDQFEKIDHVVFAGITHPGAVELSERIVKFLPDNFQKVFFSDNGSTAVEVALKMVFQYWYNKGESKKRILALQGAYHGDTFGAMSVGQRGYFNTPFEHFFFDVDFIDFPEEEKETEILQKVEALFSTGDFAGLIIEPLVQGSAGMRMYSSSFLDNLSTLARKYKVLVIFDEVMTGFGRTAKMFAMDHCEVKPDLVTLSKGLTGGVLPMGLTVTTQEMFDAFLSDDKLKALLHGHSYTGNALACAAACASLDLFEMDETWKQIEQLSCWNGEFCTVLSKSQKVKNIRQTGTILAFEIDTGTGDDYFSEIREKAYNYFLENGVLIRPLGNTVFINPPYCLREDQFDQIRRAILSFLETL